MALNLAKLKVLAFHRFNRYCPLSIDCPELHTLVYKEPAHVSLLDVKHPETRLFKSVEFSVTRRNFGRKWLLKTPNEIVNCIRDTLKLETV